MGRAWAELIVGGLAAMPVATTAAMPPETNWRQMQMTEACATNASEPCSMAPRARAASRTASHVSRFADVLCVHAADGPPLPPRPPRLCVRNAEACPMQIDTRVSRRRWVFYCDDV